MNKALKATLAAHLLFFGAWGVQLLYAHTNATVVLVETDPVDPRDLISGHYVTLRYKMGEPQNCPAKGPVWVQLQQQGEFWRRSDCSNQKGGDGLWVRGRMKDGRVQFGIERFYVNENSKLRTARSGEVSAKLSINTAGSARILALVH